MPGRFAIAAAMLAAYLTAPPVHAATVPRADYRFDVLGETSGLDLYTPGRMSVAVNDNGTAAFLMPAPSSSGPAFTLHVGTPGASRAVPTPGAIPGGGVSINNDGRVAFIGLPDDGAKHSEFSYTAWAVTPGGPVTQIISRTADGRRYAYGNMSFRTGISDAGEVFVTIFANNAPPDYALIGDGTSTKEVVETFGHVGAPHMSSNGDYGLTYDSSEVGHVFKTGRTLVGAPLTSFVYPGQGPGFFTSVDEGDVANNHWAVFNGTWNRQPDELFTVQDRDIRPVPGSRGLGGNVAINDFGTVAVQHVVRFTNDDGALYVFHDDGPHLVLANGDEFLGSTVNSIWFESVGFNNLEQLAFVAHLDDGRHVYVLASPVPEPGAVALLLAGAGAVLVRRRGGGVS
jgi:hypothetical protein